MGVFDELMCMDRSLMLKVQSRTCYLTCYKSCYLTMQVRSHDTSLVLVVHQLQCFKWCHLFRECFFLKTLPQIFQPAHPRYMLIVQWFKTIGDYRLRQFRVPSIKCPDSDIPCNDQQRKSVQMSQRDNVPLFTCNCLHARWRTFSLHARWKTLEKSQRDNVPALYMQLFTCALEDIRW